jgi:hypothetical protein
LRGEIEIPCSDPEPFDPKSQMLVADGILSRSLNCSRHPQAFTLPQPIEVLYARRSPSAPAIDLQFRRTGVGMQVPAFPNSAPFSPHRQGRARRHGSACSAVRCTLIYLILLSKDGARSIAAIAEKPHDIRDRHGQFGARSTQ